MGKLMAAKRSARTAALAMALLIGTTIAGLVYAMPLTDTADFTDGQTPITFDGLTVGTPVADQFAVLGVTFSGSLKVTTFGAPGFWPGSGGEVVQNLPAPYRDVTAEFDPPVLRAGMDIITGPDDDVRLSAFLDGDLVESRDFATDTTPTFIGVEVTGGFDALVIHVLGPSGGSAGSFLADDFRFETGVRAVLIDIKPGGDPNSINCKNRKTMIPVAILTTPDFDATTVDHTTVDFEGASEAHVDKKSGDPRRHEEDVDDDGDTDLVLHFRLGDTGLTCSSTEGMLTGETLGGEAIEGTDAVRMVGG